MLMRDEGIYRAECGQFTVALVGDLMLNSQLRVYDEPQFLNLRGLLQRADTVFGNLETVVRRPDEGSPTLSPGSYTSTHPDLLKELQWLGIALLSCANNHAYDFGETGVLATLAHLEHAGFVFAGLGRNLAAARAPGYLDTRNGRVALVAATTTFFPWSRAGAARPDAQGRPGINPLGFKTIYKVLREDLNVLRNLAVSLGFAKENERKRKHFYSKKEVSEGAETEVQFLEHRFIEAAATAFVRNADPADLASNIRSIYEARRQADWVIASIHSHDFSHPSVIKADRQGELEEPAECVSEFAHAAIDAGADIVAGHGSHTVLGIEIYKGRPIFYGLGNCIFQNETMTTVPADAYERFDLPMDSMPADFFDARTDRDSKGHPAEEVFWRGLIATCCFDGGSLREVKLHPTDAGYGRPRAQRGRPVLAEGEVARSILERIERLSHRFGTVIERRGDVGIIRVGDAPKPSVPSKSLTMS